MNEDFEKYLPKYLKHDIDELEKHINDKSCTYLDCLFDELYGSINSALYSYEITEEQAKYLRKKYLGME